MKLILTPVRSDKTSALSVTGSVLHLDDAEYDLADARPLTEEPIPKWPLRDFPVPPFRDETGRIVVTIAWSHGFGRAPDVREIIVTQDGPVDVDGTP